MSKPVFEGWVTLSGRRNRKSYLLATCFLFVIAIFVQVVTIFVTGFDFTMESIVTQTPRNWDIIALIIMIIIAFFYLNLSEQRLRDFGWDGGKWACILFCLFLAPNPEEIEGFVALIIWGVLLLVPGTRGENKYGHDPLNAWINSMKSIKNK